jgi:hypothetical protein
MAAGVWRPRLYGRSADDIVSTLARSDTRRAGRGVPTVSSADPNGASRRLSIVAVDQTKHGGTGSPRPLASD